MNIFAGNKHIKTAVDSAAARRAFSHAYIISGPKGSGKKTIAAYIAAAIVCDSKLGRPCGNCAHCKKTASGIHPDVMFIDNEGREFVVGQARELRSDVFTRPNEAAYKVYIISNAQDMNRNAQNALLTILEEPPSYAVFILLTDGGYILDTVSSRCTEFKTVPVEPGEATEYLSARFGGDKDGLYKLVERSDGNLGACIAALEGSATGDDTIAPLFLKALASKDELKLYEAAAQAGKLGRDEFKEFLDELHHNLHLSLILKSGIRQKQDSSILGECILLSNNLTNTEILHTIEEVEKARGYCEFNAGPAHLAGALAVVCWEMVY